MLAGNYRRYRVVQQLMLLLAGRNHHKCPVCTLGTCRAHIDGNSKLLTMQIRQQRTAPSVYEGLPGSIMLPDK